MELFLEFLCKYQYGNVPKVSLPILVWKCSKSSFANFSMEMFLEFLCQFQYGNVLRVPLPISVWKCSQSFFASFSTEMQGTKHDNLKSVDRHSVKYSTYWKETL